MTSKHLDSLRHIYFIIINDILNIVLIVLIIVKGAGQRYFTGG